MKSVTTHILSNKTPLQISRIYVLGKIEIPTCQFRSCQQEMNEQNDKFYKCSSELSSAAFNPRRRQSGRRTTRFLFVVVVSKAVVRVRFLIRPQSCRATLHRTRFSSFCKKNDLASPPLSVRYFVILYGSASKSASEPPPRSKSRRKYPQFEAFPRSSLVEKSMKLLRRKSILKLPNSHLHHSVTS